MRLLPSFLLWLVMLAIPVQGFAAASMLYCGMGAEHHAMQVQTMPESAHMVQPTVHMDHGRGAMDDEAMMMVVNAQVDQPHHMPAKLPDATHKCGICAACCNLIGIAEVPSLMAFAISPPAQYLEPLAQSYAAPSSLLERPPRY